MNYLRNRGTWVVAFLAGIVTTMPVSFLVEFICQLLPENLIRATHPQSENYNLFAVVFFGLLLNVPPVFAGTYVAGWISPHKLEIGTRTVHSVLKWISVLVGAYQIIKYIILSFRYGAEEVMEFDGPDLFQVVVTCLSVLLGSWLAVIFAWKMTHRTKPEKRPEILDSEMN